MQITLNGHNKVLQEGTTVSQLLQELKVEAKQVAVERNHQVVSRDNYETVKLMDGDQVEVVGFVGGG